MLEKLAQAKVVGFDITFITPGEPAEDAAFAQAIKQHGRVVLANSFHFEKDEQGNMVQLCQMPNEIFLTGAAGIGYVNTPTDEDHVVRRMTMVDVNTLQIPIPSLSLAMAMVAKDISYEELNLTPKHLTAGAYQIPLDSLNRALPTFYGPAKTFKTISYADILDGKIPASYFKDKIVLIGDTTALGHDVYPTPFNTTNSHCHQRAVGTAVARGK